MQMPSWRHGVSYHHPGLEYRQSPSSLSPLLKPITLNMKIKSRSNKPVDSSNFLWALSRKISESRHAPFNFNSQQDAAEVT